MTAGNGPADPAADSAVCTVKRTPDFELTGDGGDAAWKNAEWLSLPARKGNASDHPTSMKTLYSGTGMYFLFRCGDDRLTASLDEDFTDLYNEDVVEVFLWTDERFPVYFEYELSPLDRELALLVPNVDGRFWGWRPWHYEDARKTRHATSVLGGKKEGGAAVSEWSAECFIPFSLLKPLANVPPVPGTRWRANFYRCDYDRGGMAYWSWRPVDTWFHEYRRFGILVFE
jgi:hypothetical protein